MKYRETFLGISFEIAGRFSVKNDKNYNNDNFSNDNSYCFKSVYIDNFTPFFIGHDVILLCK